MTMLPSATRFGLGNIDDLTTPTTTAKYPLGEVLELEDSSSHAVKRYMYVYAPSTCTAATPYMITWTATAGAEVEAITVATMAVPGRLVGVPPATITATYYGWIQVYGDCTALGAYTDTYAVTVQNATPAVFEDDDDTTVVTDATIGIATSVATTTGTIFLLGRPATIASGA